jgi:hypothetical protein
VHKKKKAILYLCAFFAFNGSPVSSFPSAEISNGIIHAGFYLPDGKNGYYRGTRFDWAGVMPVLKFAGHQYSEEWFENYEPTLHHAVMGPVECFSPLGYDSAGINGSFTVIGVGRVLKSDSQTYSPYRYYQIADGGKWQTVAGNDRIEFRHDLHGPGYSYEYKKTCLLVKDMPEMVLTHVLKNTGQNIIETDVYDHNLFSFDHQTTGPSFEIIFPFPLTDKKEGQGLGELAAIGDHTIRFNRIFQKKETVYTVLEGYTKTVKDYPIRIENHETGAALLFTASQPVSKLVFWACSTTICPEPYIHLKINPGDSASWNISYQFYNCLIRH